MKLPPLNTLKKSLDVPAVKPEIFITIPTYKFPFDVNGVNPLPQPSVSGVKLNAFVEEP